MIIEGIDIKCYRCNHMSEHHIATDQKKLALMCENCKSFLAHIHGYYGKGDAKAPTNLVSVNDFGIVYDYLKDQLIISDVKLKQKWSFSKSVILKSLIDVDVE